MCQNGTIMGDSTMIQINTEEYDYIHKIEKSPRKKNIPQQSLKGKPPSPCWLCGDLRFARN